MRRMDRYQNTEENELRRMNKNQELYQNFSNNAIYTNITDVTNANVYDITASTTADHNHTTREAYQRMQKYQNIENTPPSKKELDDFNYLYQKQEKNKIYDINSVLAEARKNRQELDENEEKRRLKNNDYNILTGINKKEFEKYREEKRKRILTPEEEEIRELIDTIASKTLAGEIDKATSVDLLSDLMATSVMDKVESSENLNTSKLEEDSNIEKLENTSSSKSEEEEKEQTANQTADFYTKSMDLSDKDLELSDDFREDSLPFLVKFLIFIVIVSIIALTVYFIYQRIH